MTDIETKWSALRALGEKNLPTLEEMFLRDSKRAENMYICTNGLYVDFSKQRITPDIFDALISLAEASNVERWRTRLFAGEKINTTENRAVLHPALRGSAGTPEIRAQVEQMRSRTREFSQKIRKDKSINTIVHIGIGGSDLGPRLCHYAFEAQYKAQFDLRFVVNVDGASLNDALKGLDPASTLVISVSKSFTTQETRMNTNGALAWLKAGLGEKACDHMIAVTANKKAALDFGIDGDHIFEFWSWVGGRFSLWSAVSLSLQLVYGPDVFDALLHGAQSMDTHFTRTPLAKNLPVILAMIGIWNRNFLGFPSLAVVPYSRRLRKLPSYLQQLEMESNGKGTTRDGKPAGATCPVIWGDEGTNAQHAFFQHLHQSRNGTPVDFIAVLKDCENRPAHHRALLANCIAQSEALMRGKSPVEARDELRAQGFDHDDILKLAPQKTFPGNRPSTSIFLNSLDAQTIGALIALYEHKVFVQSVVWNINAFDQWGVELGKVLAKTVLGELLTDGPLSLHDGSTNALITLVRDALKS